MFEVRSDTIALSIIMIFLRMLPKAVDISDSQGYKALEDLVELLRTIVTYDI